MITTTLHNYNYLLFLKNDIDNRLRRNGHLVG